MRVRLLDLDDLDRYLVHFAASQAESGVEGLAPAHPYGRDDPFDVEEARARERRRWTTPLETPGWRRVWGLWLDDEAMIGHAYLAGGTLPSEMHRVQLGMGVRRSHHRQGGGRRLLQVAIEWARDRPAIDWIDLGVFHENVPAIALYSNAGFVTRGTTPDRYRVDGRRVDEIAMTLFVGHGPEPA